MPSLRGLPNTQRAIVHKYADDADRVLTEMRRVISDTGRLVLVLGDLCLRGVDVPTSNIFAWLAGKNDFVLTGEERRDIPHNHRYLPINSAKPFAFQKNETRDRSNLCTRELTHRLNDRVDPSWKLSWILTGWPVYAIPFTFPSVCP